MNSSLRCLLFCSVIWLLSILSLTVSAQTTPAATSFACGVAPLSAAEAQQLAEQGKVALLNKRNKDGNPPPITYVPIRPHIVRRSDGSGGLSLADLNQVMALANARFLQNGTGLQFYFAGSSPNYIDADSVYNRPFDQQFIPNVDVYNALNQYYVPPILTWAAGYASYPSNSVYSTRSVIGNYSLIVGLDYMGSHLIPHELGHSFNLNHTFGWGSGNTPTDELVTRGGGANCQTAGDMICDTPADPWGQPGIQLDYSSGCLQYSPLSSPRDANGEPYQPMVSNTMSYFPRSCSRHDFTPGQYERMQEGLALRQSHTAYTLDAPPTPMASPSNVVVRAATSPLSVSLSWQDNSTNEMGYFIERATASAGPFVPVGGVGTDETLFVDNTVERNRHYYYRIRPSNTTTGQLSPVADINMTYCRVAYDNGCTNNNGLASVVLNNVPLSQNSGCSVGAYGQFTTIATNLVAGQPTSFSITLLDPNRPHGVTIWADLNRDFIIDVGEDLFLSNGPQTGPVTGSITIPAGTTSGPLMVRVLSAYNTMPFYPCGTLNGNQITYEAGETEDYMVRVQQLPVSGLYTTDITTTSATLNWTSAGPGVTYDIQWRQQGVSAWSQYLGWPRNYVRIWPLQTNTAYEWQVRETNTAAYSGPVSFTTLCEVPNLGAAYTTRTTAALYWSTPGPAPAGYTLRWRPIGSVNWTTTTNLLSSSHSLTGLTTSTAYEWQVQSNCSPSTSSAFSPIRSFTTLSCLGPYSANVSYVLSDRAGVSWYGYAETGTTYRVQYRPIGTPTWQTVESLTTTSYSLTGLTGNVTYEWQVQSVCSPTESSPYFAGSNFTPICTTPIYPFSSPTATGANLSWNNGSFELNKTYDIQYRIAGTANWTTLSSQTVVSGSSFSSYRLQGLATNTAYELRIRAICPSGIPSDYTGISSFTTVCLPVSYIETEDQSAQSARLRWWHSGFEEATRFEVRYRVLGAPDWTTISSLTASGGQGNYLLTGLTNSTTYEVQIRTVCSPTESSSFTSTTFTTACRVPVVQIFGGSTARVTSANLNWSQTGIDVQYEVQYRSTNSANWSAVSNINNNTVTLSNLQSSTSYEWKVRTLCGSGIVSNFSEVRSFTTSTCSVPFAYTVSVSDDQATLGWNFYGASPETRFELRWRLVGTSMWNSAAGLTVDASGTGRYSLTGLTPNTTYEWQVRTFCSGQLSDFSNLLSFQTLSPCNGQLYTLRPGSWTDPGVWSCNRVPLPTDVVQIRHTVYVWSGEVANARRVVVEGGGKVSYSTGGRLKLGP